MPRSLTTRAGVVLGLMLTVALLLAASASASAGYEQVGTFAGGAGSPLAGPKGLAVNVSGAGGVPAGTVYAVTHTPGGDGVLLRYDSKGGFIDQKAIGRTGAGGSGPIAIAVDQVTGNVYVLFDGEPGVEVFSADGSLLIAGFGERVQVGSPKSIGETPGKLHRSYGIAVDNSGTVYVSDEGFAEAHEEGGQQSRVMVFEPQGPGEYENYFYAGQASDIAASHDEVTYEPRILAVDFHGNLFTAADSALYEFALSAPATPVCKAPLSTGGLQGMTVNPENSEVFYDNYKDGKGHQLICNGEGEFEAAAVPFKITPKPTATFTVEALALNPSLVYEPERPAGVLYAANEAGLGYIFTSPVSHEPVVESESVSRVTSTAATLNTQINPKGTQTRYAFQYITDAAYQANEPAERFAGASEVPLGGALLGGGQEALSATASLSGLAPDTEYHYRAIATSVEGGDDGAPQVFRTYPAEAPGLADERAYELVSPAQKHGGQVLPADPSIASCGGECKPGVFVRHFPMQSSPDGEAAVYEGSPFSPGEGAVQENQYLSRRTESGWQTTTLSPSLQAAGQRQGYYAFSADLSRGLLYQVGPSLSPAAPSGFANLYLQPGATPSQLSPLLVSAPPNRPPGSNFELTYAGASADFSRVFFEANDALTGETPFAPKAVDGGVLKNNLYEWAGGQLRLVNVAPGNTQTATGAAFGSPPVASNIERPVLSHAISDDGSRVFWTSEAGQVYVRENGGSTEAIPDPGKFLTASTDGSRLLLANGHLYDVGDLAEAPVDLTQGKGGFRGILGQSEDLSSIYFVDSAALAAGAEARACELAPQGSPQEKEEKEGKVPPGFGCNLYAWQEGTTTFVSTLFASDSEDWSASPVQRTAEASPDGGWLAFLSDAALAGNQSSGPCVVISGTDEFATGPCADAFLYDSDAGKLICASCNPSNARPLGDSTLRLIEGSEGSLRQPHYLTDAGRLYFDSRDSLSPFDTNDGVEDVYGYEPEGVGSCKREAGCVSLISAGSEGVDSNFLTMDETGANVFFTTRDQLVLKDRDELVDLYDARENGGIAAETEVTRSECQGEACQAPVSAPRYSIPASASVEGAGNVDERKKAKKHHKKRKHAKKHRSKNAHRQAAGHDRGGPR